VLQNLPLVLLAIFLLVGVKGLIVVALMLAFRFPARTAALTGITLAQSAEFSFLLARVGADVGAVSSSVFSLMLAAAAASIVLSPMLHASSGPFVRLVERVTASLDLSTLPPLPDQVPVRGHAVLCGYGRVGRVIGTALRRRDFPILVVEQDQRLVRELRNENVPALLGYAENPELISQMHLDTARVLIVAVPDALAARRIVEQALKINPRL